MNQPIKAVIVDDEPAARRILNTMLEAHAHRVLVAGEAGNGEEAIKIINELRPSLVFLDIHLPDLSGFEILEAISYRPNIIFTTAYEQYALKAFETFSIDYLLKPISPERLEKSLEKLEQFKNSGQGTSLPQLKEMIQELTASRKPTAFPIRQGDRILLFRFDQIAYFEADDKYIFLFATDGRKYLADQTLTSLEAKLPARFIRVQKSYIINQEKVAEIHKHFNGRFVITMEDAQRTRITSGLTYYEQVKTAFGL